MKNKKSTQIALGGLSAALCIVVMLCTFMLPFATYALPMLAGVVLIPMAIEMGFTHAFIAYCAVSMLSLIMIPDREAALMFIAFFGYYPILLFKLDKIKSRLLRIPLKLFIFNFSLLAAYGVIIFLFRLNYVAEELSHGFGFILLLIANIFFPVYERALRVFTALYIHRIRKRLIK